MPYRSKPDGRADEALTREVKDAHDAALRFQKRAAIWAFGGILALLATVPLLASVSPPKPKVQCHKVTIKYENAPEIPGETRQVCSR